MSRRLGTRRPGRGGFGAASGGGGTPPPVIPTPPLPAAVGDWWHAELDCDPTQWISQILANVLAGVNAPTVAVDAGFFNDTLVAQATATGDLWSAIALAGVGISAGDRPYMCGTWRHRTPATGTQDRMCLSMRGGSSGTEAQIRTGCDSDGAGNDFFMARRQNGFTGGTAASGDIQDTDAHFWEIFCDATLGTVVAMDGVMIANDASANPGLTTFASAVTMVAVGASFSGAFPTVTTINNANVSMKWFLLAPSVPTIAERDALLLYSEVEYGTP